VPNLILLELLLALIVCHCILFIINITGSFLLRV